MGRLMVSKACDRTDWMGSVKKSVQLPDSTLLIDPLCQLKLDLNLNANMTLSRLERAWFGFLLKDTAE